MAGYITKPVSYAYEGEHVATVDVKNGDILAFGTGANENKLVASSDATARFTCVEKTTIYDGIVAYRFIVTTAGAALMYFAENMIDINTCEAYDYKDYVVKAGELVRVHPLQIGDEFVVDLETEATVGKVYKLTAGKLVLAA